MNDLRDQLVVLTGASSGIGRAAAVQFAARGSTVVLAARRADALEETARSCRAAGGTALCVVTDVTREQDVENLAKIALSHAGRIDIWVNNAGVTLFGLLEDAPFEQHRRVIETNLYGAMFAARVVIPIFRRQKRGVLINVGSILSKVGQPFVPSYVISKFALQGLSETLRTALADERNIHVCTLFPYAVDTQHFESGANYVCREALAMPPVQSPERIGQKLVELARRPRRELHVPRAAVLGLAVRAMVPRTTERLLLHVLRVWHFGGPESQKRGNLFEPAAEKSAVHGERAPQIGAPALFVWAAREIWRIELESAKRRTQRWRAAARVRLRGARHERSRGALYATL